MTGGGAAARPARRFGTLGDRIISIHVIPSE